MSDLFGDSIARPPIWPLGCGGIGWVSAAGAGLTVLEGRAAEHERDVPFGLVMDALDDAVFQRMNDVGFPVGEVLAGIEAAMTVQKIPYGPNGMTAAIAYLAQHTP